MIDIDYPGRLVLAAVVVSVVAVEAVAFGEFSVTLAAVAGLLAVVLAAGSTGRFGERTSFVATMLGIQLLLAVALFVQGNYLLVLVAAAAALDSWLQIRRSSTATRAADV